MEILNSKYAYLLGGAGLSPWAGLEMRQELLVRSPFQNLLCLLLALEQVEQPVPQTWHAV